MRVAVVGAPTPLLLLTWLPHDLLPSANQSLRRLLALPSRPMRELISDAVLARRAAAEMAARGFRVLLYATSALPVYGVMRIACCCNRALSLCAVMQPSAICSLVPPCV